MAKSTLGLSQTYLLPISVDSRSVISLRGSPDGRALSASLAGPTTGLCGVEAALASPSPKPDTAPANPTSDISGPPSSTSSKRVDPQSCLANRFHKPFITDGSMMLPMISKDVVTPSGRAFFRLVLSKRGKSARDFGLWPAPTASRRSGLQSHGWNAILGPMNPVWIAWLQGFPVEWSSYAPTATRSSRHWPQK